jgi:SAM-dependent methyltransferase
MATLDFLPATTYRAPSPVLAHRRRRSLNTIMEDDEEPTREEQITERRGRSRTPSPKADWRSPLSDHFPTPRGHHFMVAPIIPESPASTTESEFSQTSSGPWTRDSYGTQATEFDDLYDVSSDEEDSYNKKFAQNLVTRASSTRKPTTASRVSTGSIANRMSLPSLIIPSAEDQWVTMSAFKKLTSPVPPTPPPKVPMSPAVLKYLHAQNSLPVPSSSAPPSLDGSYTSEQLAQMSAPPTPNIGNDEEDGNQWGGVQLQPAAMATLQALSGGDEIFDQQIEQVIEISTQLSPTREMQQSPPPINTNIRRHNSVVLSPTQQASLNDLTALEIPSPGGFFSSLSNTARHTWHMVPIEPDSAVPPSSTTAEHFYKTPWTSEPIERIIEVSEVMSDGCPTARPILIHQDSDRTITADSPMASTEEEIVATEILADYDDGYVRKLEDTALEHFDRTKMWLTAQTTYLSALINPTEDRDDEAAIEKRDAEVIIVEEPRIATPEKKRVRFSEVPSTHSSVSQVVGMPLPKLGRQESAYFRSFRNVANQSRYRDTYVHRIPRFEALQIQRVNFPEAYRNQLLGKYQLSVVPMSAKKRMSANVARGDEQTPEDPAKVKADKEREAREQMNAATWNVMATKMLNGGRLIAAPVAKKLARLSRMGPDIHGAPRDRARILDLGGQATCDWAWHCAAEYPNAKIYSVCTKASRQISNSNIRGPNNHRQVAVEKLTKLPFKDNQFDLISARHLYSMLKVASEHGEDEYDACLAECMRCLKPGGYLEFSVMDSDIVNAGSLGQAKSVEFGFNLKTRGYDAAPTKAWLGRLRAAGFVNVKRAWLFLPMGAPSVQKPMSRDSMGVERPLELEAMVSGSTDAAASITGLVGSWAWEKWMLKLQMESGSPDEELLRGVFDIVEEGRKCGAGWRTLNGWARKPLN